MDYLTTPLRYTAQAQAVEAIRAVVTIKDWTKMTPIQAELKRWLEES